MTENPADPHEGPTSAPRYDLGVLLVHGIGVQRRGETLADFGRPILEWLHLWCDGLHDRWVNAVLATATLPIEEEVSLHASLRKLLRNLEAQSKFEKGDRESIAWAIEAVHELLDDVESTERPAKPKAGDAGKALDEARRFAPGVLAAGVELLDARRDTPNDPEAPAHARLVIRRLATDGSIAQESWLVAESWWAETFWPPKFSELARWGLRIVPWTLGSHYSAAVRRIWAARPAKGVFARARWSTRLIVAALRLLASLPLALLAQVSLALLFLLAAIPIPQLRKALGTLQRQIAAIVGDSYILLARPIEAASMVGQVRRDLAWLARAARFGNLAVLAHSQGAAMAYDALSESPPRNLRLLITFGSGMRKLEELRNLAGPGSYRLKAMALTLGGLLGGALYSWVLLRALAQFVAGAAARDATQAVHEVFGMLAFLPFAVGGFALVAAGLADLLEGMELPGLHRRIDNFARSGVRWVDCYATHDPVPNGPLLDRPHPTADAGENGELPASVELCNEGSTIGDHTAYWRNRDEFVSRVVAELMAVPADGQPLLTPRPAWADTVTPRRRWRLQWLRAIRALTWPAAALAIIVQWNAWRLLITWSLRRAGGWLAGLVGFAPPGAPATLDLAALRPAAGALLLALLPALAARILWRRWDVAEMLAAIRGGGSRGIPLGPLFGILGQVVCAAWIASMAVGLPWLPIGVVVADLAVAAWLIATQFSPSPPGPAFVAPSPVSRAGCTWTLLFGAATFWFAVLSWLEPAVTAAIGGSWWKLLGLLVLALVVVSPLLVGFLRRRQR